MNIEPAMGAGGTSANAGGLEANVGRHPGESPGR